MISESDLNTIILVSVAFQVAVDLATIAIVPYLSGRRSKKELVKLVTMKDSLSKLYVRSVQKQIRNVFLEENIQLNEDLMDKIVTNISTSLFNWSKGLFGGRNHAIKTLHKKMVKDLLNNSLVGKFLLQMPEVEEYINKSPEGALSFIREVIPMLLQPQAAHPANQQAAQGIAAGAIMDMQRR